MKKQVTTALLFLVLVFLAGCDTFTSKATADVCDDACQQERDEYVQKINSFLAQAEEITAKVDEGKWKTVTQEDFEKIKFLKSQVFALNVPDGFELIQEYYQRAFTHFVEAIDFVVVANENYGLASGTTDVQAHNVMTSQVVYNVQEANRKLVYAEEEAKFATRMLSSL